MNHDEHAPTGDNDPEPTEQDTAEDAAVLPFPDRFTKPTPTPETDSVYLPDQASAPEPVAEVPPVVAASLREDVAGDRPLMPQWIRTKDGRRTMARARSTQARRAARRWLARQRTHRGHPAQAWRGIRRSAQWTAGFEGAHVQAAGHQAHIATREARDLARRARFTLLPGDRALAQKQSEAALAVAVAAVAAHKKAKSNRRRIRFLRALVAFGIPAAVVLAAYVALGAAGLWLGLGAVLAVEAFLGRRPDRETVWGADTRALSDGDPLTESMLDRAFKAAKVIGDSQQLTMVTPCAIDPAVPNAWHAVVDLPDVTVKKAAKAADEIAAAMGIDRTNLDIRQVGSNGRRMAIWACGQDPFLATRRNPLVASNAKQVNTWRDGFPLAFDKRGNILRPTLSDYSFGFFGATRSGKGMGLANLLAAAMLDPRVRIRLFDGKGAGEYVPHARALATYVRRNPKRLAQFLRLMVGEMNRRTEILVEAGLSKANEKLIDKLGGIELVVIDELATYTAKNGPSGKYAEEITELLAQIAAVGAAVGIVLALATQYPEAEIVTPRLRGNVAARMAMRVESPGASNVALGDGMVGQGYDASKIPIDKTARGRAWLTTPDTGVIEVRSLFIDENAGEILPLIERGIDLRTEAGCLPDHYDDPIEAAMARTTGVSAAAGGPDGLGSVIHRTVLDHLLAAAEQARTGQLTNAEALAHLAGVDPARYARQDHETENAWLSRTGKTLRTDLADLGADVPLVRLTVADGTRPNGYTLQALKDAFTALDNAA
ncbi:FtsK/SpoIIIE domain-containing protein [Streptomyces sp. TLI_171]|uniref:FtsK/SpoIIIE domain-containing protein n=1 Tax=Streptomyces sp. TLI_171 TaxID=1938859 RepID=UPI000C191731|nr:FtsK/SpoIIIE domain-containing protein [Streptomyces sp. TLI_171]RKE19621.1 S-DNA-T family DNA segregation ATPase FtsK/SpoIIIE [Streptomyces sp. TLI_171]